MALRPLHLLGSPALREESAPVDTVDDAVRQLVDDMFQTMDASRGVGLAANQIGITQRVAVIDAEGQRFAMINPRLVEVEGKATAEEGCLSIPDVFADVTRPERVVLEALDAEGRPFRLETGGLTARAIQHEIDHLDGILFFDRVTGLRKELTLRRLRKLPYVIEAAEAASR